MSTKEARTVVTEEDLVKSLTDLEGKVEEVKAESATSVTIEPINKSTVDAIKDFGSETLRKSLDVSEVLDEVVTLMGAHVDETLATLEKSIKGAADRDMAMIRVLETLKKSIDSNTAAIDGLLNAPAAPAATRPITTAEGQILTKSVTAEKDPAAPQNATDLRKSVLGGLEKLIKSTGDKGEASRISNALVKFESTGEISDQDMSAALKA